MSIVKSGVLFVAENNGVLNAGITLASIASKAAANYTGEKVKKSSLIKFNTVKGQKITVTREMLEQMKAEVKSEYDEYKETKDNHITMIKGLECNVKMSREHQLNNMNKYTFNEAEAEKLKQLKTRLREIERRMKKIEDALPCINEALLAHKISDVIQTTTMVAFGAQALSAVASSPAVRSVASFCGKGLSTVGMFTIGTLTIVLVATATLGVYNIYINYEEQEKKEKRSQNINFEINYGDENVRDDNEHIEQWNGV